MTCKTCKHYLDNPGGDKLCGVGRMPKITSPLASCELYKPDTLVGQKGYLLTFAADEFKPLYYNG